MTKHEQKGDAYREACASLLRPCCLFSSRVVVTGEVDSYAASNRNRDTATLDPLPS
jgi:hypothetical protein